MRRVTLLLISLLALTGCGDGLPKTDKYAECQRVQIGEETLVLQTPYGDGASPCPTTLYQKNGKDVTITELGYTICHVEDNIFEILYDDYSAYWEPAEDEGSDGMFMGHCYYRYPCYYENGEFREYATIDLSENEFISKDGAKSLVDSLATEGWQVTEIFSRQDGHLFLNLRQDLEGGRYKQAFVDFTEGPELSEGKILKSIFHN